MQILDWLGVIRDLFTLGTKIAESIREGDFQTPEEILGPESRTEIARRAAEIRAESKFGPRNDEDTLPPPSDD